MIPSVEYQALQRLAVPPLERTGDLWRCDRLGMVMMLLGVKRGMGKRKGEHHFVTVYHWEKPVLHYHRADFDPYSYSTTAIDIRTCGTLARAEGWYYVGNLFDLLPYHRLARPSLNGAEKP